MTEEIAIAVALIGVFVAAQAIVDALLNSGRDKDGFLDHFTASLETGASTPSGSKADPFRQIVMALRRWVLRREESSDANEVKLRLNELQKADLNLRPIEWLALRVGAGVFFGSLMSWRTNIIIGAVVGAALATFGARAFLRFRQGRRANKLNVQLGQALLAFASALRSGNATQKALRVMANGSQPPLSDELARMLREQELGLSGDAALQRLAERNRSEELDLVVAAMQINQMVGGNLAEVIDNIAETIRERVRIKAEIRVITAQARVSGYIISVLPIFTSAVLMVIAPDYFDSMFSALAGWIMIGVTLFSMTVGALIIRKIVSIRV